MSAIRLLQEHRGGTTHEEISDAIREVVAAVSDERKAGKVTITVSIKPLGKQDGLDIAIECKAQPPKQTPGSAVFFATVDNDLQRQDPRQTTMELREIKPNVASALA